MAAPYPQAMGMSRCCWVRPHAAIKWRMGILFTFSAPWESAAVLTQKSKRIEKGPEKCPGPASPGRCRLHHARCARGMRFCWEPPFLVVLFFPPSLTLSSCDHLLPTTWGTLAWWRSAQSVFVFSLMLFSGRGISAVLGSTKYLPSAEGSRHFTAAPSVLPVVCSPCVILSRFCKLVKEAAFLSRGKAWIKGRHDQTERHLQLGQGEPKAGRHTQG